MSARFKLSKPTNRAIAAETRDYLARHFPNAFSGKGADKRPLKIGIHEDLVAANVPLFAASRALRDYTRGPTYLRNLVEGAPRFDLRGYIVGTVTAEEAQEAKTRLACVLGTAAAVERATACAVAA